jgi:hypothetical protein
MKLHKIINASIKGTILMSLFSYIYSRKEHHQFREPVLLAHLLAGIKPGKKDNPEPKHILGGWALHYLVGISFLCSYEILRKTSLINKFPAHGAVVGGLYGILGILGWETTFQLHPNPPIIPFKHYYTHLLPAHMIYGYFAFNSLEKKKSKSEQDGRSEG